MIKYPLILLLIVSVSLRSNSQDASLSALDPYLKKSVTWRSSVLNKDIPFKIYYLSDSTVNPDGAEVIVYLKNKAWDRIGQEPDLPILRDYIQKKFIVITADYGNEPQAISPHFDKDLHDILKAVYGFQTESLLNGLHLLPKDFRCFFLPEGYRVATDLVYWEIDKHAVYGTMEFIMKSYNENIVSKYPGLKTVSSPAAMVDRKGNPFDYKIKMDIIYPSQARKKLPVVFLSETLATRNPNDQPSNYVPHFAGFATRGYVHVVIGHCFNPCVTHFFHFSRFTLDHENGYACYTAAMRFLHANADKYSMNTDHIGGLGISKGEYAITRLSDPHHEARKEEVSKFEGFPAGTPEPQPWQGYSSKIQAGMQGMGMGLFETEFITADYVPNIIFCGEHDREVITKAHPVFVKRLEELGANHIGLFMTGLAHEYPYGYDERLGVDRYQLVHDFFDRYLKVEEKLAPVILIASPFNSEEAVSPSSTISVQFAPVIDEKSILEKKGIRIVLAKTNQELSGSWKVSHGGTKFTFTPEQSLQKNKQYKIIVTSGVKDKAGTKLEKEKSIQFKVAGETQTGTM
ncbi:MAG: Ig-like domain-containing protein [Ferruginibacter sp.]